MIENFIKKIGKRKVFLVLIVFIMGINILLIGNLYSSYETFYVKNEKYRYMGTENGTSKIRCEDGTMYELTETRKVSDDNFGAMNERYRSDYVLKTKNKVATYISVDDGKDTTIVTLFNGDEFKIDESVHNELMNSMVSISKKTGDLKYDFKYDDTVPFEYRFIESAIMYHSGEKDPMNVYNMVFFPFVMSFTGVLFFVYPREFISKFGILKESITFEPASFIVRMVGVVSILVSIYSNIV